MMTSIAPDGAFTLTGVPLGRFLLRMVGGNETKDWALDSAKVGDIDAADVPLEVERSDIADVAITMTDAKSWLRGRLTSASGAPLNRTDLIVFPMEAKYQTRASRRVLTTRTDMDGRFELGGLPAGSYGSAIVDEIDRDALQDPVFLAKLPPVSTLTLHRGETLTHDIVVPR